jgi:hypothetical protein
VPTDVEAAATVICTFAGTPWGAAVAVVDDADRDAGAAELETAPPFPERELGADNKDE